MVIPNCLVVNILLIILTHFITCIEENSTIYDEDAPLLNHTYSLDPYADQEGELHPSSIPFIFNVVIAEEEKLEQEPILTRNGELQQASASFDELLVDYSNLSTYNSNCSANFSCLPAPTFQYSALTRVVVLLFIAIFSLVGNVATLSSILRTGRQGTSTVYMLLVQLALADLLVSVFCILADALWTLSVQWYGGNLLCKFVKFMQLFSLYLSTFLLVVIGFDRLCAVRFPMRRVRAKHHVRVGIGCVWTLSALFSLPQVFIFSVMRGPFVEDFEQCVTYGFYTAQWQEQLYTTLTLVLMFLLPLLVLLTTYVATFLAIASRENIFSERNSHLTIESARQKILRKAKVKSLMITVVIVLTFVVCWTPYYVTMIIFMFLDPSEQLSQDLQKAIFFFGSSTAAINPLIYGAFHLRPRQHSHSNVSSLASSSRLDPMSSTRTKSRHERISLHVANEDCFNHRDTFYKQRYSRISSVEHRYRISPVSSVLF